VAEAVGIHAHSTWKLGKRPTDPNRPVLHMGAYLTQAAFQAPAQVDYARMVNRWLLGGNDKFGTCGPTSVANFALLVSTVLAGSPVAFTDDEVFDLYRRSGNPHFDPNTGADDNGVDMTVMLSELVRNGIGSGDRNVKALAFGSIDSSNPDQVWAAGALFGGVLWGADLHVAQQNQTNQGLWDYAPTSGEWGGHAILASPRYKNVDGTASFVTHQVPECYVVIFPWHMRDKGFLAGLDLAGVAAEYKQLTGRDFPASPPAPTPTPTPVPPIPTPTPTPPGPPGPNAFPAPEFEAAETAFRAWLKHHRSEPKTRQLIADGASFFAAMDAWLMRS
jgi:hypothetical protein